MPNVPGPSPNLRPAWVLGASLWDDTGRGPDGKIDDRILSDSTGSYGKNSSVMDIIFFFLKIPSR